MVAMTTRTDQLHRYIFQNSDVRGEWVNLDHTFQAMIANHDYPAAVANLLGELAAATSLLTATLKFKGEITVQLQGDGPVRLAVINGNEQQQLRGVARYDNPPAQPQQLTDLVGKGLLVITITPENGERYQGMVAIEKATVAACLEDYFGQSEQLPTQMILAADVQQGAAGLMLQSLPAPADKEQQTTQFEHLTTLAQTLSTEEMLSLPGDQVLHRLFHQDPFDSYEPQAISFVCGCSRESSANALVSLGREEAEALIAERGSIDIDCQYCNTQYHFTAADLDDVFAGNQAQH